MLLRRSINRIIFFIACILPFISTPGLLDDFYFIKACVLILCVSLILLKWIMYEPDKRSQIRNLPLAAKLTAIYWGLNAVSLIFSIDRLNSVTGFTNRWNGFILITAYCLLLIFSSLYFELTPKRMNLLVTAGSLMSLIAFLQFFGFLNYGIYYYPIGDAFSRSYGLSGNPNYLGAYLVVVLSLSIYRYLDSHKKIYLAASSLIYGALLTTLTRGTWLGAIVSIVILFAYYIKTQKRYREILVLCSAFAAVTIGIDLLLSGMIILRFFTIFFDFGSILGPEPDLAAGSQRMYLWTTAMDSALRHPLFGVGVSNMHYVFALNPALGDTYNNTHNEFIHIAATTGIPSAITYILILLSSIGSSLKNITARPANVLFIAAVTGYAAQSFFSSSVVSFSFLIWIFVGAAGYLNSEEVSLSRQAEAYPGQAEPAVQD